MSARPPRLDDTALVAVMGGRAPQRYDRRGRVELIGQAAEALLAGKLPADEARLFVAGALVAWLAQGGNLEKDFFKITRPHSHVTPSRLWRQIEAERLGGRLIADERQDTGTGDKIAPSPSKSECRK